MKQKEFNQVASIIIILAATLHFVRVVFGWELVVNGWEVPAWVSWIAVVVGWYVGFQGLRMSK
jgi:hypothetical protein